MVESSSWARDIGKHVLAYSHTADDQLAGSSTDTAATTFTPPGWNDESFAYDATGNRLSHTTGPNNQLLADDQYDYTYDAEGRRLTRTDRGTGLIETSTWDHRSQLQSVTATDTGGAPLWTVSYRYDHRRNLVARTHVDHVSGQTQFESSVHDVGWKGAGQVSFGGLDDRLLVLDAAGTVTRRFLTNLGRRSLVSSERYDSLLTAVAAANGPATPAALTLARDGVPQGSDQPVRRSRLRSRQASPNRRRRYRSGPLTQPPTFFVRSWKVSRSTLW